MKNAQRKKTAINLLKLIGIALFVWIVSRIDRASLMDYIIQSDKNLLGTSFGIIFVLYFVKTVRWHFLVRSAGQKNSLHESWKIFNIGVFLGMVTPAKLGELGRAAFLAKKGMKLPIAFAISILDRIADVIVIALLGVAAVAILFGVPLFKIALVSGIIFTLIGFVLLQKIALPKWVNDLQKLATLQSIVIILMLTLIGWSFYFLWALLLATSIGITIEPLILVATFTATGIVSMLPIAPSGLGTRDAALLTLLAPYGIEPSQAVALALFMFVSIVLSSVLGGIYFSTASSQ